jgi:hypothetical protein
MTRTDTERLDWLTRIGRRTTFGWVARDSLTGRGFRLHQSDNRHKDTHMTPREAIDAAMDAESAVQNAPHNAET